MDKAKIWAALLNLTGGNAFGAAGLMGNLYAESALNPRNLQQSFEKKLGMTDDSYTEAVDSGAYTKFVRDSAAQGKALNDVMTQYQNLTVNADSSKIENAIAKKIGKVVVSCFVIKANVLAAGYNQIDFTISGVSWVVPPVVSFVTSSTTDDGKNFYIKITSTSNMQIRASASNANTLECTFVGCIT